jgi:hypothetical protein
MKMRTAWCALFTGGAAAIGGAVYGTIAAGAACKQKLLDKALPEFQGNFFLPQFSFNTSMSASAPVVSMNFHNITGDAGQFLTPSLLKTIYETANDASSSCMWTAGTLSLVVITLALAIGTGYLSLQGQINDLKKDHGESDHSNQGYRPL